MKDIDIHSELSYTIHYTLKGLYGYEDDRYYCDTEDELINKINSLLYLYSSSSDSFKKLTHLEVYTIENFILD